jgi:hypothetical protein
MYRFNRVTRPALGFTAAALLAACDLPVQNQAQPDIERALGTPALVQAAVGKYFQQLHQGAYNTSSSMWPATQVMAFESASQLGNFGMGTRSAIPRGEIDNSRGNKEEVENFRVFDHFQRNGRQAVNAILKFDGFMEGQLGRALGTKDADALVKAVAFFNAGWALGQLSLHYDSAAITTPTVVAELPSADAVIPLSGATDVNKAALEMLDSALHYASMSAAAVPADWFAQSAAMPNADLQRLIRSYRAKFRAGIARTPEERAAVDWTAVTNDATNGITKDFTVNLSPQAGWSLVWWNQALVGPGWAQQTPFIIGMADVSGGYDAWLAKPVDQRSKFLIVTPDQRFPQGADRPTQIAITGNDKQPPSGSRIYFRNRPQGDDSDGYPWGSSFYDYIRFGAIRSAGMIGPWPHMTQAENDMLAAEGYLRQATPNFAAAAALIDRTRVPNGLPSVAGITSMNDPVPGGADCVPRVPRPGGGTACGNIFEAMKWEKRLETMFTGLSQWWIDSRGWGDLVSATPLEYPVPYQELDARYQPIYHTVRVAGNTNTYGF